MLPTQFIFPLTMAMQILITAKIKMTSDKSYGNYYEMYAQLKTDQGC